MRAVTSIFRLFVASVLLCTGLVALGASAPLPAAAAGNGVPVMGPPRLSAAQLAAWFRATNRTPKISIPLDKLTGYYISEGLEEGVRGDIAFAQSVVETGYFGFVGSIVKPANNNFAGMGACDSCNSGRQFRSARAGIRAQIQHLKNFADPTSRAVNLVHPASPEWYGRRADGSYDPILAASNFDRFFAKGKAPTWNQMGGPGKWASTPHYGDVVLQTYNRMLVFNGLSGTCPSDRLAFAAAEARDCPLSLRHAGRAVAGGAGGYYVLNGNGAVKGVGAATFGAPAFSWDIARDIVTMPDGNGYVILDGYGGIHLYGSARTSPLRNFKMPYFGFDIARQVVVTPDSAGLYVLDGYGGVHVGGTARKPTGGRYPYWRGWDIARSMSVTLDGRGLAILDGFGGVWRIGTVGNHGANYFGWDIGRDIVVAPDGSGYAVLDGFGGISTFGNAPGTRQIGYAAFDRWRSFVNRNGTYTAVRNDGFSV